MATHPDRGDVVIRQKRGNSSTLYYLLGTLSAPDQFIVRTRDEAVSKALAFAEHAHVQAWLAEGRDDLVLLEDFEGWNPSNRGRCHDGKSEGK